MNLHSQHLGTILKVYPKAILTPIILGKVSSACSEVSKEYAKGFLIWVRNNITDHIPADQLLSLYDDHLAKLEKEKIK